MADVEEFYRVAFVYGTLRVSDGSWSWAKHYDPDMTIEKATTSGNLYYVGRTGGYPVADLDGDGTIIGDVLFFPRTVRGGQGWDDIYRVEVGAGYEPRTVAVQHEGGTIEALAWHHPQATRRGPQITTGNYCLPGNVRPPPVEEWFDRWAADEDDDDEAYDYADDVIIE